MEEKNKNIVEPLDTSEDYGIEVTQDEKYANMTEDEILNILMGDNIIPTKTLLVKRLGLPVTLKAITSKENARIKKESSRRDKRTRQEELDWTKYCATLICRATTNIDFSNPALLSKFNLSSGEEYVLRKFLAGEIESLAGAILDLSGMGEDLSELDDAIKND